MAGKSADYARIARGCTPAQLDSFETAGTAGLRTRTSPRLEIRPRAERSRARAYAPNLTAFSPETGYLHPDGLPRMTARDDDESLRSESRQEVLHFASGASPGKLGERSSLPRAGGLKNHQPPCFQGAPFRGAQKWSCHM